MSVINKGNAEKAASVLRAVNHDLRQKIVLLLNKHGRLTVKDIYVKLRIEQSVASAQLKVLRDAKVVEWERVAKERYYSNNNERIDSINEVLDTLAHL